MANDFSIKTVISAVDRMTKPIKSMVARSTRALGKLTMKVGKLGLKMGALAGAGFGAAGAAALKFADSYSKSADDLSKFARRAGVGVEAYQEIRHAAELAGVTQEQFDSALMKFTRTVGEAKAGTGKLNNLLKKTSPELLNMVVASEDNEAALELMLSAMGKLEDPTKRAALAAAAFGRSGQKMTLLLEGGEEGFRKARMEAHELGMVISKDAAQAAESYVDSSTRLKRAIGGVTASIGAELLPLIQPMIDRMVEWMKANKGLMRQRLESVFSAIGQAMAKLGEIFDRVAPVLVPLAKTWTANIMSIWETVKGAFGDIKEIFGGFVTFLNGVFLGDVGEATAGLSKMWRGISSLFDTVWSGVKTVFDNAITMIDGFVEKFAPAGIKLAWSNVKVFFKQLWADITGFFQTAYDKIVWLVKEILGLGDKLINSKVGVALGLGGVDATSGFGQLQAGLERVAQGAGRGPLPGMPVPVVAAPGPATQTADSRSKVEVDVRVRGEGGADADVRSVVAKGSAAVQATARAGTGKRQVGASAGGI